MEHDLELKVRINGDLKSKFKEKYGKGMSKRVRELIIRDLEVSYEVVSNSSTKIIKKASKKDMPGSDTKGTLTAQKLQQMVDGFKMKGKK